MPDITFFSTHEKFRKWLERHSDTASELWLGFYKLSAKKKGMTYAQALDEALCFGWIDAVRKSIDDESYTIRFTSRKPKSIWSNVNVKHVERLIQEGRMRPSGLKAFEARDAKRTGIYSFEKKPETLPSEYRKKLKANKKAWKFFDGQAPWYKRTAIHWVMTAKQEITRKKRLAELIADSANEERIKPLRRNTSARKI